MTDYPPRRFGPKTADHPGVGKPCPACQVPFAAGDYTTLVTIGPGTDPEAQERARAGRAYNAVAVEAHWACVTGERIPTLADAIASSTSLASVVEALRDPNTPEGAA